MRSAIAAVKRMRCPNCESCGFTRSPLQIDVRGHEDDYSAVGVLNRVIVAKLGSIEVDYLAGGDRECHAVAPFRR